MPRSTRNLVMDSLICCTVGLWINLKNLRERKMCDSLQINNIEVTIKTDDTIKVSNHDQRNIASTNSWKPYPVRLI